LAEYCFVKQNGQRQYVYHVLETNLILHETTLKGSVTTYFLYLVTCVQEKFDISIGTNCTPLSLTCSLIRMKQTANKSIS
jgi:hypothetical protein